MEHTLSIHDSSVPSQGAAPEPFELPSSSSSYDATYEQPQQSYDAPVPQHALADVADDAVDVEVARRHPAGHLDPLAVHPQHVESKETLWEKYWRLQVDASRPAAPETA